MKQREDTVNMSGSTQNTHEQEYWQEELLEEMLL
jgi:hypothetical protein